MAAKTKIRMAMSLMPTIMLLVEADSRMPRTRMTVRMQDDEEGGNVEAEVPAGMIEPVAGEILQALGQVGR